MRFSSSPSEWPWARVASFWLTLLFTLVQVPVTAQSKPNGPTLQESSQKQVSSLLSLSEEQVASLTERKNELSTLNDKLETLRQSWLAAEQLSMGLSVTVSNLRQDLRETSQELSQSVTDFEAYKKASEDRAKVDNDAFVLMTKERDEARAWNLWAWVGGAILGASATFLASLAF